MKLFKGTIRPGKVMEVLENGVIKASSPGLFSFTDDPEKLPPIMPWQIMITYLLHPWSVYHQD